MDVLQPSLLRGVQGTAIGGPLESVASYLCRLC